MLTPAGRDELAEWLSTVDVDQRLRDAFFLQLVTAVNVPSGPDALGIIDRQRRALLRRVREVQLLEGDAATTTERLAIERSLLHLQADLRWLELCETSLSEQGPT
ncbi:MAG TPA: hypothetical protein VHF25_06795 [Nitriliruptorales bacterium]|nr:hypothetical protein [Nitriliruptorales bacterium]